MVFVMPTIRLHLLVKIFAILSIIFSLFSSVHRPSGTRAQTEQRIWLPLIARNTVGNPVHAGVASYYDADGSGSCMFGPSPDDLMVAAMNEPDYGLADYCGAHVAVSGPNGQVIVRIVDMCPGCRKGLLDLSPQAFTQIGNLSLGRVPITWQVISPEIVGPIAYHFKDGSNQWWTAVQIRNHRNPVAKFEYRNSRGNWVNVLRAQYNYFIEPNGMGPGPYTFRVTDLYGNELIDSNIPHVQNGTVPGTGQFPFGP